MILAILIFPHDVKLSKKSELYADILYSIDILLNITFQSNDHI